MHRLSEAGMALFILLLVAAAGYRYAEAQGNSAPPRVVAQSGGNGRYQIVNGTPEMARNIMLLDTATGKTWVYCGDSDKVGAWCPMERY